MPPTMPPLDPDRRRTGPNRVDVFRRRGGAVGTVARALVAVFGFAGCLGGLGLGAVYVSFAGELTTPAWRARLQSFDEMAAVGVTRFEAADGSLVGEVFAERRLAVAWEEIPQRLIQAVLAVEDSRFFAHDGIDLRGLARAMVVNLTSGNLREGASTITQQLAKTLVGSERALSRKVTEAILARRMEDRYSKEQILTWYLNIVYLGHGSYGIKAAAQNYFRKPLAELSLAELATLAGLPQSPGRVTPVLAPEASRRRTHHVLDKLLEQEWSTADEVERAKAERPRVYPLRDPLRDQAPAYTEPVRRQASALLGPEWAGQGLTLTLGLDPGTQRAAERSLATELERVSRLQGYMGPLGQMDAAAFLARNAAEIDPLLEAPTPPVGRHVLARIDTVQRELAVAQLTPEHTATLALDDHRWAVPRTEQPTDGNGRRDRKAKVSFDGKLTSMVEAFAPDDIVLVEILPPPEPPPERAKKKGTKSTRRKRTGGALPGGPPALRARVVALGGVEGALVSLHPDGRTVDARVGGRDFDQSEVDRTRALRQLGSLMKPIVYGFAYELGLPPSALLSGAPFREGRYNPTGARAREDMFVWDGLVESENSISLRVLRFVLDRAPLEAYAAFGRALGLSRALEGNLSEVLGMDQTVSDAFRAYSTFASGGRAVHPEVLLKAVDRDGRIVHRGLHPLQVHGSAHDTMAALHARAAAPPMQMVRPSTAWLVAKNLEDAARSGTGQRTRALGFPVAGKTGTLAYDVWFAGFSDRRTTLVWMGDDRRHRTLGPSERDNRVYGSNGPLPAWIAFMGAVDTAPKGTPRATPAGPPPPDIVELRVDPETGLLAREDTPRARPLPHRVDAAPTALTPAPDGPANVGELEGDF